MSLSSESKFLLGLTALTLILVSGGLFLFSKPQSTNLSTGPTLSRQELILGTSTSKGNQGAQHFLVEFSDFQCPACKAFKPIVDQLLTQYSNELLFTYRHFPLDQHAAAFPAAQAAEAAGKQGKFWEMYSLLFENQEQLSKDKITELAKNLGLNMDQYQADFATAKDLVLADRNFGLSINVNSTPTFYLDGQKLTHASPNDLIKAVEQTLQN